MYEARKSRDDKVELAAANEYLLAWMNSTLIKMYAASHFKADYVVNRITTVQTHLKRPEETVDTNPEYNDSSFRKFCSERRPKLTKISKSV